MIEEQYVSFEVAKLLKEKGFEGKCHMFDNTTTKTFGERWNVESTIDTPIPTQQMAMRWLREVYGLYILIGNDDLDWNWQIFDIKNRDENLDPICKSESYGGIHSYEIAVEEGVKYCLEHLID